VTSQGYGLRELSISGGGAGELLALLEAPNRLWRIRSDGEERSALPLNGVMVGAWIDGDEVTVHADIPTNAVYRRGLGIGLAGLVAMLFLMGLVSRQPRPSEPPNQA
jgi:hypothetical protein